MIFSGCRDEPLVLDAGEGGNELPVEMLEGIAEAWLLDDFDDGDAINEAGGEWIIYDDTLDNGQSETVPPSWDEAPFQSDAPGYGDAGFAAHMVGTTGNVLGYDYVGFDTTLHPQAFCPDSVPTELDLNAYDGIEFMVKGTVSSGSLVFKIPHLEDGPEGCKDEDSEDSIVAQSLTNWADYMTLFQAELEEDWSLVRIRWSDLAQPSWRPAEVPLRDVLKHAKFFTWEYKASPGTVELWIDNVALFKDLPDQPPEDAPKDMVVRAPDPPKDEVIENVAIANPLQTLAMEALNRGYNVTNWLEQGPFVDFDPYDEQYVEKLAEAGFKALRLPIDLDLYLQEREAYFAGEAELTIDPTLFAILDSFEEWTADQGLSLTIDYHQYDGSMDFEDPLDVQAMLGLWAAVAEHFADNPREDLFLELMNEPEQSANVGEVSAETWTRVAKQAIEAIREHDPDRVLLFGDVGWNGIGPLVGRTPFSDSRIIYVFHFYEPFLFTHQGASWTNMTAIHDIPYPYSPDRWSEHSSDLGLDAPEIPAWVLIAADNYYRDGNKSALRNRIIAAKRWAVDHDVPVLCNEFGAYDGTSRLEDRIRFLADLTDIFAELQIPWQHWFMVMDPESGAIDPQLQAALGLD